MFEVADELAAALASAGTAVIPDMHIAAAISTVVIFLSLIFILSFRFAKRIFVVHSALCLIVLNTKPPETLLCPIRYFAQIILNYFIFYVDYISIISFLKYKKAKKPYNF